MLGALVASMTIGAFCLDWMQPTQSAAPTAPGIGLIARGPVAKTWEGIRIEARPQDAAFRTEESHFLVYRNGNRVQTSSWESRRVLGSAPVVLVTLVTASGPQSLTSAQRMAAWDLVGKLQRDYAIPDNQVRGVDKLGSGTLSRSGAKPTNGVALAHAE
jgi:hypothetical protein